MERPVDDPQPEAFEDDLEEWEKNELAKDHEWDEADEDMEDEEDE